MKLSKSENSTNYAATVVELESFVPIPGKDRIQITTLAGNNVIISKEAKIGDCGVYFVSGTQLSAEYCYHNNLYDNNTENKDTTQKGFISFKNRRVRCLKFGGVISDGLYMPLKSLLYLNEL